MTDAELAELEKSIAAIEEVARGFGLDFFPMRFELCPADVLYTFGAYGMPTRFSHWSFGKAFYRMKTEYDYNLSRIYELVINSNPCYAFLLEGNSLLQNKVVAAHVFAHSDFFKNNACFRHTSRWMLDSMEATAARLREYEYRYGRDRVEQLLDAALSIQEHVDPYRVKFPSPPPEEEAGASPAESPASRPETPYDDLWALDELAKQGRQRAEKPSPVEPVRRPFPRRPEKDLLLFLAEHSTVLEPWERDVLHVLRDEMLYFWPQLETKIMNEGWAAYWHARIMRELPLSEAEAVEFAKMHAYVVQPSVFHINPYLVGMKIFEDIERRWNEKGEDGREKIFEVRETESDASFLRNYLTRELVEDLDLYVYRRVGDRWEVVETDWEAVRDHLVRQKTNCGFPVVTVVDADYAGRGELYLEHRYEGLELDLRHLEKVMAYLYRLWGRRVILATVIDEKPVRFGHDGKSFQRVEAA